MNVPPSKGLPLDGTNWVLDRSAGLAVPIGDVIVSAEFQGGIVSGTSGCNRYHAAYTLNGPSLTIGPIAATQMACGPDQMAVERAFLSRLAGVGGYRISGSTLTLLDEAGRALLEFGAPGGEEALVRGPGAF